MAERSKNSSGIGVIARLRAVWLAVLLVAAGPAAAAETLRIVAFGDSLTAGYGLAAAESFPVRLEAALEARGLDVEVVDAGVSGDTSTGGLARLDWAVDEAADAVIVELGANDALRGVDPGETRRALGEILERLTGRGVAVLLAGMRAPPNMGPDYAAQFDPIYAELAARHGVAFYPFFLDGVAGELGLNQEDGMHPNADGVAHIVEAILPAVIDLIDTVHGLDAAGGE
jgi:acyl-CoA thioesterase-1